MNMVNQIGGLAMALAGCGLVLAAVHIAFYLEGCNRRGWPLPLIVGAILIAAGLSAI